MTSTIAPTSQEVSEWVKIFPKHPTESLTSSVTFMKQLTVVAISTITYLKSAFPEDSYMVESFGGIKLRILKKKCRDDCAQFVSTSLIQAFEAFDKKYLHQLALCFYEEECRIENLIEYHIFDYCYQGDGVTMKVHSKSRDNIKHTDKFTFENIRERTIHMIRFCVVLMQSCQNELPSTYNVSLRLYYNEDTPSDYQAPGFICTGDEQDHLDSSLSETIRLGWVETPFHKLVARSYIKDTATASHEAIASQNPPMMTSGDVEEQNVSNAVCGAAGGPGGEGGGALRCPCNLQERAPGQVALLTCHYCRTQQHAACFGVSGAHAALLSRHCCADCHGARPARRPTDGKLTPLSARKKECLCIYRRTLEWCTERVTVNAEALIDKFGMSELSALKLMKLLKSHKIIEAVHENNFNVPQTIRVDQLKSVIGKFFQSSGEGTAVERFLAETYASPESSSDPISEVVSPLGKVSLQNGPSACPTVEPVEPMDESNRDALKVSALKQYMKSVDSNDGGADGLGKGVRCKTVKRKVEEEQHPKRLGLRSGVRSKRARSLSK